MSVIWKFGLRPHQPFIDMPRGARLLHVGVDVEGEACVWALCDPQAPKVPRYVVTVPTGADVPRHATSYVGTFKIHPGLIFHVFEGEAVEEHGVITAVEPGSERLPC